MNDSKSKSVSTVTVDAMPDPSYKFFLEEQGILKNHEDCVKQLLRYVLYKTLHGVLCILCRLHVYVNVVFFVLFYSFFRFDLFSKKKFDYLSDSHHDSRIAKKSMVQIALDNDTEIGKKAFWEYAYPIYVKETRTRRNQINNQIKARMHGMSFSVE